MNEKEMVDSFSGAHPFRPAHLKAVLEREEPTADIDELVWALEALVTEIDTGRCPRCGNGLDSGYGPDGVQIAGLTPSGSRVTACRCVPVCSICSGHESLVYPLQEFRYGPWDWMCDPRSQDEMKTELDAVLRLGEEAIMVLGGSATTVITQDGASPVVPRKHPGGWLEFGHDDEQDRDELRGR
jgi:hypothetical protein